MTVLLRVQDLVVSYGRLRAINGVSLAVPDGRIVALLGPNGAGKSSLLAAIAGLAPRRGLIRLGGTRIDAMPAHRIARQGVCLIPEGRGVFPSLTVAENLRLANPSGDDAWHSSALQAFPAVRGRDAQVAATLSGGEQQMLALARAVASQPRLLLLDEPSLGLAPRLVGEVYASVARLKDAGRTILLVEQFAHHALRLADVVYVMAQGKIVFAGEPGELSLESPLVERYLGGRAQAMIET